MTTSDGEAAGPRTNWPALGGGLLAVAVWWLLTYGSIDGFVESIDVNRNLFADFVKHYHWQARIVASTEPERVVPGFFYSPFFAILLWPLHGLSAASARWPWAAVQLIALAAWVWLPLRMLRVTRPLVVLCFVWVALTSFPALHNFTWGQISVPLLALTLWSTARIDAGQPLRPAAYTPLGIAAGIKYYPAGFLLGFAAGTDKQWIQGTLRAVIASAICLLVIPTLVLGWANTTAFYETAFANSSRAMATWVPSDPNSQYFGHVVLRWLGSQQDSTRELLRWLGWALAAAQVSRALWWSRRLVTPGSTAHVALRLVAVASCAVPLVLGTSWPHYFAHLPFVALLLWCDGARECRLGAVDAVRGRRHHCRADRAGRLRLDRQPRGLRPPRRVGGRQPDRLARPVDHPAAPGSLIISGARCRSADPTRCSATPCASRVRRRAGSRPPAPAARRAIR